MNLLVARLWTFCEDISFVFELIHQNVMASPLLKEAAEHLHQNQLSQPPPYHEKWKIFHDMETHKLLQIDISYHYMIKHLTKPFVTAY